MKDTYVSQVDASLCRLSDGAVIRKNYSRHYRNIANVAQLKACIRAGKTTDLGGYPLYFITSDGAALSFDAVRKELRNVISAIASRQSAKIKPRCDFWEELEAGTFAGTNVRAALFVINT